MDGLTTAFQNDIPCVGLSNESNISSFPSQERRVRVPENTSWMASLKKRFDELTSLRAGWDGYAGKPVSFNCAMFSAMLIERLYISNIPPPQLVPGSDGSLQLEWHQNQIDIEIDILKPYGIIAAYYNHITDEEREVELKADFTVLSEWLTELVSNNCQQDLERGSQFAFS